MSSAPDQKASPPRIWALLGAHPGDNDQVLALAEALDVPFVTKQLTYNGLRRLGPQLLGASFSSLTAACRHALSAEEPPDLTISAGHRSVPIVRALQRRSGGRARAIHIGFPRISPGLFDLVIATPQYPVPDHPHVLRVPYALTTKALIPPDEQAATVLDAYPSPRQLLLVGGPTMFWEIDQEAVFATLQAMLDSAADSGGSVLVTTSPRTPARLRRKLKAVLTSSHAPTLLASPKREPTLATLLSTASSVHVTADSVAMISDAIWTGKPLAIVPIVNSKLGKLAFGMADRIRPGKRVYPRDHRFFWRELRNIGIGAEPARPHTSPKAMKAMILHRVRPIVEQVVAADTLY